MKISKKIVLHFPEELVAKPITYELVKNYDIIFNILKAKVAVDDGEGMLLLELTGTAFNIDRGLKYLRNLGVKTEPLTRDIQWLRHNCIMCGICASVCPGHAFYIIPEQMILQFKPEKCIGCEECFRVCPYHAIKLKLI
ncbi:MAG: NIL domain-containing protein [bacterium]